MIVACVINRSSVLLACAYTIPAARSRRKFEKVDRVCPGIIINLTTPDE